MAGTYNGIGLDLRDIPIAQRRALRRLVRNEPGYEPGGKRRFSLFLAAADNPKLERLIILALKSQAFAFAGEIVEIADQAGETPGSVAQARLRIEARRFVIERLLPDYFADRKQIESNTVNLQVNISDATAIVQARRAARLGQAGQSSCFAQNSEPKALDVLADAVALSDALGALPDAQGERDAGARPTGAVAVPANQPANAAQGALPEGGLPPQKAPRAGAGGRAHLTRPKIPPKIDLNIVTTDSLPIKY